MIDVGLVAILVLGSFSLGYVLGLVTEAQLRKDDE